ncbi:hypothetical protein C7D74_31480 [Klebsiella pneumoniae]|nr:hypothetical protein C7D74_31480 [Klebsiella pneumoniae]
MAQAQKIFARMDSAGQARMSALHQGSRDNLRIAAQSVGRRRTGARRAGTALVGNPQQVAERIREYQALGISNFIPLPRRKRSSPAWTRPARRG